MATHTPLDPDFPLASNLTNPLDIETAAVELGNEAALQLKKATPPDIYASVAGEMLAKLKDYQLKTAHPISMKWASFTPVDYETIEPKLEYYGEPSLGVDWGSQDKTVTVQHIQKTGVYLDPSSGKKYYFQAGTMVKLVGCDPSFEFTLLEEEKPGPAKQLEKYQWAASYYNQNHLISEQALYDEVKKAQMYSKADYEFYKGKYAKGKYMKAVEDFPEKVKWNPEFMKPGYVNKVFEGSAGTVAVQGVGSNGLVDDILGAVSDG